MAINKVVYGGNVLIDLTGDTLTPDKVLSGFTGHGKDGAPFEGTCKFDVNSEDASAVVAEILEGKTAYARGAKITGTMPNRGPHAHKRVGKVWHNGHLHCRAL